MPPTNKPTTTKGLERSKLTVIFSSAEPLVFEKNDSRFMDSFDHVLTVLVNQAQDDKEFGIPFEKGTIMKHTAF